MSDEQRNPETGFPVISTPNGKKWAWETIGKGVGGALTIILLGLLALIGTGRLYAIYGLPPRMDQAEDDIRALRAPRPMSSPEVDALAAAIVARLPQPRKGKP